MKITGIKIENFKAVSRPISIEIKPVTLIFGPNNSGKSTVLHAFQLVASLLDRRKLDFGDPRIAAFSGGSGFRQLVHGGDLRETIRIRIDFDMEAASLHDFAPETSDLALRSGVVTAEFAEEVEKAWVSLALSWSEAKGVGGYISHIAIGLKEDIFAVLETSPDLRSSNIQFLNFDHPLLGNADTANVFEEWLLQRVPGWSFGSDPTVSKRKASALGLPIATTLGAVPSLEHTLGVDLRRVEVEDHAEAAVVVRLLSNGILGPIRALRDALNRQIHIGPLRVHPDREFLSSLRIGRTNWYDGSAAWVELAYSDEWISRCNEWLADRLDTGLQLVRFALGEPGESRSDRDEFLGTYRVGLRNQFQVSLAPNEVGAGISQIIPVIAALVVSDRRCPVIIEQPELHLHPRLQTELGDLFGATSAEFVGRPAVIVETHSEHLLLRLLRRVREKSEGESSHEWINRFSHTRLAVYYSYFRDGTLFFRRLDVSEKGDFTNTWPDGFFEERVQELF